MLTDGVVESSRAGSARRQTTSDGGPFSRPRPWRPRPGGDGAVPRVTKTRCDQGHRDRPGATSATTGSNHRARTNPVAPSTRSAEREDRAAPILSVRRRDEGLQQADVDLCARLVLSHRARRPRRAVRRRRARHPRRAEPSPWLSPRWNRSAAESSGIRPARSPRRLEVADDEHRPHPRAARRVVSSACRGQPRLRLTRRRRHASVAERLASNAGRASRDRRRRSRAPATRAGRGTARRRRQSSRGRRRARRQPRCASESAPSKRR